LMASLMAPSERPVDLTIPEAVQRNGFYFPARACSLHMTPPLLLGGADTVTATSTSVSLT